MNDLRPETRIPFRGRIHLLVPFEPWRLRLPLNGIDLGRTGLSAFMAEENDTMVDAFHVLTEHSTYELQLAPPASAGDEFLAIPPLRARLSRKIRTGHGLELEFSFETMDALMLAFIEQKLSDRNQ